MRNIQEAEGQRQNGTGREKETRDRGEDTEGKRQRGDT